MVIFPWWYILHFQGWNVAVLSACLACMKYLGFGMEVVTIIILHYWAINLPLCMVDLLFISFYSFWHRVLLFCPAGFKSLGLNDLPNSAPAVSETEASVLWCPACNLYFDFYTFCDLWVQCHNWTHNPACFLLEI